MAKELTNISEYVKEYYEALTGLKLEDFNIDVSTGLVHYRTSDGPGSFSLVATIVSRLSELTEPHSWRD